MEDEEAEFEMYKRHMRYFEETKAIGTNSWRIQNQFKARADVKRDMNLFFERYSRKFKLSVTCSWCSEKIRGLWHRCFKCIDVALCDNCYNSGRKPNEHLDSHETIEFRLVKVASNFYTEQFVFYLM